MLIRRSHDQFNRLSGQPDLRQMKPDINKGRISGTTLDNTHFEVHNKELKRTTQEVHRYIVIKFTNQDYKSSFLLYLFDFNKAFDFNVNFQISIIPGISIYSSA